MDALEEARWRVEAAKTALREAQVHYDKTLGGGFAAGDRVTMVLSGTIREVRPSGVLLVDWADVDDDIQTLWVHREAVRSAPDV